MSSLSFTTVYRTYQARPFEKLPDAGKSLYMYSKESKTSEPHVHINAIVVKTLEIETVVESLFWFFLEADRSLVSVLPDFGVSVNKGGLTYKNLVRLISLWSCSRHFHTHKMEGLSASIFWMLGNIVIES